MLYGVSIAVRNEGREISHLEQLGRKWTDSRGGGLTPLRTAQPVYPPRQGGLARVTRLRRLRRNP